MGVAHFFRTPKGLLLIVLAALVAVAAPAEGPRGVAVAIAAGVVPAAVLDAVVLRWRHRRWELPSGAILTGLIVAMVLTTHEPWFAVTTTAAIGVASKYVWRAGGANVLNPAAVGLVATFYLFHTGESWWGALPALPPWAIVMLAAGGIFIADRVNKLPLVLAFLGLYFGCFAAAAFAGPAAHVAQIFRAPDLQTALYFAFFIATDPPTSPVRHRDQMVCGAIIGAAAFATFETIGAVYYLLAGVLAGNLVEAGRRWRLRRARAEARRLVIAR